jgi:hypothetical protein
VDPQPGDARQRRRQRLLRALPRGHEGLRRTGRQRLANDAIQVR